MEIWEEDLYDLLGVAPEATIEEIKKAYKKLAIELHPDRFPNDDGERAEATLRFGKITNAYNILKDEEERAEYDFARRMGYGGGAPAKSGSKRTAEEEDGAAVTELKKSQALNQFDQGRAAHQNRNWPKAIACYKEATRLDTTVADYPAYLGLAYLQQGLKSPANSAFAKAYKLDKTHKILLEHYSPQGPAGAKGKPGANGKKGSEKPGLLDQLKALLEKLQRVPKSPAKGKKGAPAKKGTGPLKKTGAKK